MESQTEKSTDRFYSFFVNMRNKMMLNQELIKEYDVETLSARLKDLLGQEDGWIVFGDCTRTMINSQKPMMESWIRYTMRPLRR